MARHLRSGKNFKRKISAFFLDDHLFLFIVGVIALAIALPLMVLNHYSYESYKEYKCKHSVEWIVCAEVRFLASNINGVSLIEESGYGTQTITVELKTRTLQIRVANGHLEETLQVIKEAAKEQ